MKIKVITNNCQPYDCAYREEIIECIRWELDDGFILIWKEVRSPDYSEELIKAIKAPYCKIEVLSE